jgi:hypothetical protein
MSDLIKIPLNDFMPQLLLDLTKIYENVKEASEDYEEISKILLTDGNYIGKGQEFIEGANGSTMEYFNKLLQFYSISITYLASVIQEEGLLDKKIALILNDFIESNLS